MKRITNNSCKAATSSYKLFIVNVFLPSGEVIYYGALTAEWNERKKLIVVAVDNKNDVKREICTWQCSHIIYTISTSLSLSTHVNSLFMLPFVTRIWMCVYAWYMHYSAENNKEENHYRNDVKMLKNHMSDDIARLPLI